MATEKTRAQREGRHVGSMDRRTELSDQPTTPATGRYSRRRAAAMLGCAIVALLGWVLSAPPGASPDDGYHYASIWCAQGIEDGRCLEWPEDPAVRAVPLELTTSFCYYHAPEASAECQVRDDGRDAADQGMPAGNWTGGYPPVYYTVMSLFVGQHFYLSIILMRLFTVALTLGSLAVLIRLLPSRARTVVTLPALVTAVPLSLFIFGTNNPSAWAILSALTVWPALYFSVEVTGRRRLALLGFAVVMTLVGAGARADAALFSLVALGMVALMRIGVLWRDRRAQLPVIVAGVVCAALSILLFLSASQSSAVTDGFGIPTDAIRWQDLLVSNLQTVPNLWVGGLGFGFMGSLGWLDTPMPTIVGFLSTLIWAGFVFWSWRRIWAHKLVGMAVSGLALAAYPLVMLQVSGLLVGNSFQPRYEMPLLVVFTGVSMLGVTTMTGFSRLQIVAAALGLAVANAVALHIEIRRYVTGLDVSGLNLDARREWWWSDSFPPATSVWVVGSLAFLGLAFLVLSDLLGRSVVPTRSEVRQFVGREAENTSPPE